MWTRTDFRRPDFRVVDGDGHLREDHVDWAKRLPKKYADWAPQAFEDGGRRLVKIQGKVPASPENIMGVTEKIDPVREPHLWYWREGMKDPLLRIEDMDYEGIDVAVSFGSMVGNHAITVADDAPFAAALSRAYNDWAIDEYCGADPKRLLVPACLPLHDPKLAVEEVYHAKEKSAIGVQVWPHFRRTPLHDPRFDIVWAAAEEVDLPVCVHVNTYMSTGHEMFDRWFFKHAFLSHDMMVACTSFVGYGILEKHPNLRVGFFEGSSSWAIWLADRLNEHWELLPHEVPWQTRSQAEWMRSENVYYSAEPGEGPIPQFMQFMNPDTIGFNSDYAHWDSSSPDSVKIMWGREDLTDEQKQKLLGENAARFFKIPSE